MKLFRPVVEEKKLHQNFRNIVKINDKFAFDVLTDWASGFVDRDGKFIKEFQTSFNSSFWELYLFAVLKHYGYEVDFSKNTPDFCIPHEEFCIEATISSNPIGGVPEYLQKKGIPPNDLNEFNRHTIIRLLNSIVGKYNKYITSYSKLPHAADKPFVLAVAGFDQPYNFLACQRAVEAVLYDYYVDEEDWIAKKNIKLEISAENLEYVQKNNGAPVQLGIFNTNKYSRISAVIFSSCATWGKVRAMSADSNNPLIFSAMRLNTKANVPHIQKAKKNDYSESLLDGLRIYHNPNADFPFDPDVFRHPDVFQSYFNPQTKEWVYEQRDGQLLCRFVNSLMQAC